MNYLIVSHCRLKTNNFMNWHYKSATVLTMAIGGSTVVEHTPHQLKVTGLSLATSAPIMRERNYFKSLVLLR